jgi:hypothetical protein
MPVGGPQPPATAPLTAHHHSSQHPTPSPTGAAPRASTGALQCLKPLRSQCPRQSATVDTLAQPNMTQATDRPGPDANSKHDQSTLPLTHAHSVLLQLPAPLTLHHPTPRPSACVTHTGHPMHLASGWLRRANTQPCLQRRQSTLHHRHPKPSASFPQHTPASCRGHPPHLDSSASDKTCSCCRVRAFHVREHVKQVELHASNMPTCHIATTAWRKVTQPFSPNSRSRQPVKPPQTAPSCNTDRCTKDSRGSRWEPAGWRTMRCSTAGSCVHVQRLAQQAAPSCHTACHRRIPALAAPRSSQTSRAPLLSPPHGMHGRPKVGARCLLSAAGTAGTLELRTVRLRTWDRSTREAACGHVGTLCMRGQTQPPPDPQHSNHKGCCVHVMTHNHPHTTPLPAPPSLGCCWAVRLAAVAGGSSVPGRLEHHKQWPHTCEALAGGTRRASPTKHTLPQVWNALCHPPGDSRHLAAASILPAWELPAAASRPRTAQQPPTL